MYIYIYMYIHKPTNNSDIHLDMIYILVINNNCDLLPNYWYVQVQSWHTVLIVLHPEMLLGDKTTTNNGPHICMHIYVCVNTCVYKTTNNTNVYTYVYACIYIYIYIYVKRMLLCQPPTYTGPGLSPGLFLLSPKPENSLSCESFYA